MREAVEATKGFAGGSVTDGCPVNWRGGGQEGPTALWDRRRFSFSPDPEISLRRAISDRRRLDWSLNVEERPLRGLTNIREAYFPL